MNRHVVQAVIFDLDGIIVDSEPLHEQAYREIFAELGFAETHGVHYADFIGRSDEAVWQDFLSRHRTSHSLEALLEMKRERAIALLHATRPVLPGLAELVTCAAGRYKLAIASGSEHAFISEVLAVTELRRFFPVIVSAEDVPHGKPAPDIFLRAAAVLEVAPSACCVIEDSVAGVAGALAAGMQVIALPNTVSADKLTRATRVVRTYAEVEELLLGTAALN